MDKGRLHGLGERAALRGIHSQQALQERHFIFTHIPVRRCLLEEPVPHVGIAAIGGSQAAQGHHHINGAIVHGLRRQALCVDKVVVGNVVQRGFPVEQLVGEQIVENHGCAPEIGSYSIVDLIREDFGRHAGKSSMGTLRRDERASARGFVHWNLERHGEVKDNKIVWSEEKEVVWRQITVVDASFFEIAENLEYLAERFGGFELVP